MEYKHTPGPWHIGKCHGAVVSETPVTDGLDNDHVEVYGGHLVAESISPKNRSVIAAAPDLFDALVIAEQALNKVRVNCRNTPWDETGPAIITARAAIAKALGVDHA